MASQRDQNAKESVSYIRTMDEQQKRLQRATEPLNGLSQEQMNEVLRIAKIFQEKNLELEREKNQTRITEIPS
mgnify:CR=1 FL=1